MLKRLAKDSIIYGGADFCTKLVAFSTFPLVATALSTKAYGFLELGFSSIALLAMVVRCGANNSVQRFYWDKDTAKIERPAIVSSAFTIQLFLGSILILIGYFLSGIIVKEFGSEHLLISRITVCSFFLISTFGIWHSFILDVTRLHFKPWSFFFLALVSKVGVTLFSCYILVYQGGGLEGFLFAQVVILFLLFPVSCLVIKKDLTAAISKKWMISTFKFGYPFIYVGVAIWLFSSIDRWMLTFYTSLDEVGIYSVAFKFSSIILFVSTAFGMAWSPISIKLIKDYPNDYKEMYSVLLLVLMFVMVVLASIISIFSGDIVNLILNEEYKDSAMPLVFLCFGIAINTTGQITAAGISIEKKTYLFARVAWFAAIFNFVLNMIFIPIFGSTGAAFTTFLSHLFVTSAYLFYSQKIHYVPFQYSKICSFFIFVFLIIISSFLFHLVDDKYDVYILKISIILILILVSYKLIPKDKFKRLLRVNISND